MFAHHGQEMAHVAGGVEEHVVAEIDAAHGKRRHFGVQGYGGDPLCGGHSHRAAGADLHDDVAALGDLGDDLGIERGVLRGGAIGAACVDMDNRRAGGMALGGGLGDFVGGDG